MISRNSNQKAKISVIIPTFNEEDNIKETLISIKRQICNIKYEVVVADGQSNDNTVKIAKKYSDVIISPKRGKAFQLNYVVPRTSGDILVFLDADTIVPINFLQKIYNLFERKKRLFACSARFKYTIGKVKFFHLGSKKFSITTYFFHNWGSHIYYTAKMLFGYPELAGCNIIVRRDIFFKVGGFKNPPKGWGIDKTFSDAILYLIKKEKFGKIRTLSLIHVFTSARKLSIKRGLEKFYQYQKEKKLYTDLATDSKFKHL
ncbi:MAG: glycosyltransferase family 2 protein [Candidatus Helarchaeota archaeon]